MTHYEVLFTGTLTNTIVHPREVYYEAIKNKAASIVVVHNHPSGDPSPSMDDNKLTKVLKETGKIMGITQLANIIIGNGAYYSYAEADIDNWQKSIQNKQRNASIKLQEKEIRKLNLIKINSCG